MFSSPLVSIIIPCYNYGKFLGEALESILEQSYQEWECIIVNDGSTDETEEVALRYVNKDKRFKYFYHENEGHSASRNRAVEISNGAYIQFLDADDMLERDKIRLQVLVLEENPTIGLVYSDVLSFENEEVNHREYTRFNPDAQFPPSRKGEDLINAIMVDNLYLPGCVIMRKQMYYDAGGNWRKFYGFEDWEFWFRTAYTKWEFYHDAREGTRLLRRHHNNNTSANISKMWATKLEVRKEILNIFISQYKQNKLRFSEDFIAKTIHEHKRWLGIESVIYHFVYGNIINGFSGVIKHAYYSGRPFFAVYDAVHFLKERFKRKRGLPYQFSR